MKTKAQAILFRIGGLGDLMVALPAISLVRRNLPGFSLTLAGRPEYGALLKQAGLVAEVLSFEDARMAALFSGSDKAAFAATNEASPATDWLREFSLALGWLNRRGDWPTDDWWARQGIKRTSFISYESETALPMSRFFFDRTLDFLKTRGIRARVADRDRLFDECALLDLGRGVRKKALADLRLRELKKNEKRLVVHPGSGGRAKRWLLPGFVEVIRGIASRGLTGVLVTGEAEADLEARLEKMDLPAGWARFSRLPAETLAGLLAESTHYLGNDSGPTHLAAACGASALALFRDDSLPAWRPFGKTRVISAPSVAGISYSAVQAALDDLLARQRGK
jgi:heptosyltransferase-3